mgnify:CR=1 FL=1
MKIALSPGSPPQVRGKLEGVVLIGQNFRITPAGAGKTAWIGAETRPALDHPRRCGENFAPVAACMILIGSPPQVRGKHSSKNVSMLLMRITPAGAGKTFRRRVSLQVAKDHPRRCGENPFLLPLHTLSMGSPPQVRGKPFLSLSLGDTCRITPAGAGKTPTFLHCITVLQDHPRRCGENFFCVLVGVIWRGSPPQVRGKPRRPRQCRSRRRITPAGAGKTAISIRGIIPAPDHPRRCGENYAVSMYSLFPLGSPPQVRGKPGLLKKSSLGRRITPAGAGKTCSELAVRYGVADHPRRCGENLGFWVFEVRQMGSPPQVRGKPA